MKRSSGILMHISSLPGDYGIGDFGKGAYEFIDFLVKSKVSYWQILPLGITSFGDSPYQCFSAFAGNPYFIDLDDFIERSYLSKDMIDNYRLGDDPTSVDYGLLYENKLGLIRKAYNNSKEMIMDELESFYQDNISWLREFSLFMALKTRHKGKSWINWEEVYRKFNSDQVLEFEKENIEELYFWIFTQYFFYKHWEKLKKYANENKIQIIGDLPIYVAVDSSDTWSKPDLFNLDENLIPFTVSGYPPDDFSEGGQLWGNPIYNWDKMEDLDYSWWVERITHSFSLYDYLRIDHFIGFEAYWEVPYGSKDASPGKWTKGPSKKLFRKLRESLGELNIIAEDLGLITDEVRDLIEYTGFPGMNILQFAFDSKGDSDYMPHNHKKNSVVYTGTHDNPTILSWTRIASKEDLDFAKEYLRITEEEGLNWAFIRGAFASPAKLAIIPLQDFLGLGDEGRMNTPSTMGGNWTWRLDKTSLGDNLAEKIGELNRIYRRSNT